MSYDILFVRTGDVEDKLAAAQQIVEADDDGGVEPSPEADERRRRLVRDLLEIHPSMKFEVAEEGESYGGWIGSDDNECPFPTIELDIDGGMLAISYSVDPEALSVIAPVVEIFARHGYVAYDPQIGGLIDAAETRAVRTKFTETHSAALTLLQDEGETVIHPVASKPWWKLW